MEKLKSTQKITIATLKAFAKRNEGKIYSKEQSSFDGITDCVEQTKGQWQKSEIKEAGWNNYYKTGIQGIYTVGQSRDYLTIYEDSEFYGIEVYNCCGKTILAVKK